MKVIGLQFDVAWEDPETNFARVRDLARRAAEQQPDLLVLPEMFNSGFTMRAAEMAAHAEASRDFLRGLAGELGCAVMGGLAEAGDRLPANAAWTFAPDGRVLSHFRKIHPFSLAGEQDHYEAGGALAPFEWAGVRVCPFICYDLRFPEPFRIAAPETDLFVVIAHWPERRSLAWKTLLRARAIENQAFVLGVNRVGVVDGQIHSGDSALIDPMGEIVTVLSHEPGLVTGTVAAATVSSCRERFSFLSDRRPSLYLRLSETQGSTGV
ncbi:MAG: carbon-nitrogen family hydrolase [Planctomycetes bacterium]|nr:carbon-nitrogen family hydrolase [Planctomycetota bacterium]